MFPNDYFTMMYEYLVIDEKEFSNMDKDHLFKYLSNKRNSYKLRRPLNDYNGYNYIPILCKGYCQQEAEMFVDKFNKALIIPLNPVPLENPPTKFLGNLFK